MKPLSVPVLTALISLGVLPLPLIGQSEYTTDGTHTPLEEEIRWLVNRARFDTASENAARGTAYNDVPAYAPPLAPHQSLTRAALHHSEDMAKNDLFQHATIPGSAYYDPVTQPNPWDRMAAEGYAWNGAGENIAAGYAGALEAYVGWWNSTGHRVNQCNASLREIGNGYFFWQSSSYRRYYTMNLGRSGSTHFFTDTVFHDANGNQAYNQNEGVAGIRVSLRVNGAPHTQFDLSTPAGSFAVPIQSILAGATVEVFLANPTAAQVQLSVPRDYHTFDSFTLAPDSEKSAGTFVKGAGSQNFGFRDLTPATFIPAAPTLALDSSGADVHLRWLSQAGAWYMPQATPDFVTWTDLAPGFQAGTGGDLTWTDSKDTQQRFYRVIVIAQ